MQENCRDERRRRPVDERKTFRRFAVAAAEKFPVSQSQIGRRAALAVQKNAGHVARAGGDEYKTNHVGGFGGAVGAAGSLPGDPPRG